MAWSKLVPWSQNVSVGEKERSASIIQTWQVFVDGDSVLSAVNLHKSIPNLRKLFVYIAALVEAFGVQDSHSSYSLFQR